MIYDYIAGIIGDYPVPVLLTFYFLFLTVFGDIRVKISSFIVFLSSLFIIITASYEFSEVSRYVNDDAFTDDVWISVLWDGATGLILIMFLLYDENAWKQALLLAFATIWHTVVLLYLTTDSILLKDSIVLIYIWYDEFIILVSLLQLWVSRDGMADAIRRVETYNYRNCNSVNDYSRSIFS